MNKYGVIEVSQFANLTYAYENITQVLTDANTLTGWILLKGQYSPEKITEVEQLGGQVFELAEDYNDWRGQLMAM